MKHTVTEDPDCTIPHRGEKYQGEVNDKIDTILYPTIWNRLGLWFRQRITWWNWQ